MSRTYRSSFVADVPKVYRPTTTQNSVIRAQMVALRVADATIRAQMVGTAHKPDNVHVVMGGGDVVKSRS
jgi:hypothetical protein